MSRVDFYRDDRAHWIKRSTIKNGLWLDGKLVSQEEIDRLIGLSIVNIPHTIILGQKQDLFFDLKPSAKLDILSETLQLDRWEERSKRARERTTQLETEQSSVVFHMAQLDKDKAATLETIADLKEKVAAWEKERSQADMKREDEQERLTKALADTIKESGTYDLQYDRAETELRAIRKDLLKKANELDDLNELLVKAVTKHHALKREYDDLKQAAESDICPTCNQTIADHREHARVAKARLREVKAKRDLAHDRAIVRETQIELLRKAITIQRNAEEAFGSASDQAKDYLDHCTTRVSAIKQQIAVLKAQTREDEVNPYADSLARARDIVKKSKAALAESEDVVNKLARRITRTKYWIDGFKQVRLYLLQETLEELQEVTQNLLPSMGLSGWIVEYAIERENKAGNVTTGLTVTILKPGMSKAVRWEAWSGGEGQRLLIAGALALSEVLLRRAGIECDLLVLDEPTRHMSREGVMETVDHLIERGRNAQIFYCDHAAIENSRFASVITIEKDETGAHVNVE
jgi:DNA repair exonuclease SbcCD ATPase subunit